MNAAELKEGQYAKVSGYTNEDFELKLIEFGFVKGALISLCYKAPLGCPIALQLEDTIVSLRKEEASQLLIQTIDGDDRI